MTRQNAIHREKVTCEQLRKKINRINQKLGGTGFVLSVCTEEGKRYGRKNRRRRSIEQGHADHSGR